MSVKIVAKFSRLARTSKNQKSVPLLVQRHFHDMPSHVTTQSDYLLTFVRIVLVTPADGTASHDITRRRVVDHSLSKLAHPVVIIEASRLEYLIRRSVSNENSETRASTGRCLTGFDVTNNAFRAREQR